METLLERLTNDLANKLLGQSLKLVTAESCTGGWISQSLTALPGSSLWFEGGIVSYSNHLKHKVLDVSLDTLTTYGAVSEPVAQAMAAGALKQLDGDIAIAVTGIAGPSGAVEGKPAGTVWIGWASASLLQTQHFHFEGDRERVRYQAMIAALQGVLEFLQIEPNINSH